MGYHGLSEIRRKGEKLIRRTNDNMFYFYSSTAEYRGVGFYIKNHLKDRILEVKGIT